MRRSGTALGNGGRALLFALLAILDASKSADDADEGAAICARITLGGALLVPAGPAYHRIAFAEDLAHLSDFFAVRVSEDRMATVER
jgi:hypothetical protein